MPTSPSESGIALPPGPWLESLGPLELWAIPFEALATRPLTLQDPLCSVLRGLLGDKLRELRCLTRAPTCQNCSEIAGCDFVSVFDAGLHEHTLRTPPYWLQGVPIHQQVQAGQRIEGRLVVLGSVSSTLPYLEASLRDALRFLGRPSRQPHPWSPAFSFRVKSPVRWVAPEGVSSPRWSIRVLTPLVLRDGMAPCILECPQLPELVQLVRAGARRRLRLHRALQGNEQIPPVSLPDLREIQLHFGQFIPWSGSRFSQRQLQRMPMAGVLGEVEIEGEALRELSPLLSLLPLLSVGKQTTMGLGHLEATPLT